MSTLSGNQAQRETVGSPARGLSQLRVDHPVLQQRLSRVFSPEVRVSNDWGVGESGAKEAPGAWGLPHTPPGGPSAWRK